MSVQTTQPVKLEQFRPALPFSHVIWDTKEHILIHRIGTQMWAALNSDSILVPIVEKDFEVLPTTHHLSFCISNEAGLVAVPPLNDMIRQMNDYNWTNGLAIQNNDVWNWDTLKQEWILNGTAQRMVIMTRCGELLLPTPNRQPLKSPLAKLCGQGHWNTRHSKVCKHCKIKM